MIEAVAYGRVSTDADDQLNSLGNQLSFLKNISLKMATKKGLRGSLPQKR